MDTRIVKNTIRLSVLGLFYQRKLAPSNIFYTSLMFFIHYLTFSIFNLSFFDSSVNFWSLDYNNVYYFQNRLNNLDSQSSLDSVFLGIANRVNTQESLKELKDLIWIYNINKATETEIIRITEENLRWIATYSGEVQEFLDDFFNGSKQLMEVSCFLALFCVALNLIMNI